MFIRRIKDMRLKPGITTKFFRNHLDLFQKLKDGEKVKIPQDDEEEILFVYKGMVKEVKDSLKKKLKKKTDEKFEGGEIENG